MSLWSRVSPLVLAAALVAGPAHAKVVGGREASQIAEDAIGEWIRGQAVAPAVTAQLNAIGVPEEEQHRILSAIDKRAVADIRRYASTLEGQILDGDPRTAMDAHVRILCFDIQSQPRAFAANRPMSFVVTDAEAARLDRGLAATWIEHEAPLREKLKDLVMLENVSADDVPAVRFLARERTLTHAKQTIATMRGASFFSAADAELYLENVIDADIDHIRNDSLTDPRDITGFVEEARTAFAEGSALPTQTTDAGTNVGRDRRVAANAARRAPSVAAGRAR